MARAVSIRRAGRADAPAVCAIYNERIAERQATFETTPRTIDDVLGWFDSDLPFLVADSAMGVVGWARASAYSFRCVYEGVGEHGVYVSPAARGRQVGRRLLDDLAPLPSRRASTSLTSRVFTTNEAHRAVHRAAGFFEVGGQPRHGRLDGEWKDCVLVQRLLGPARLDASTSEGATA